MRAQPSPSRSYSDVFCRYEQFSRENLPQLVIQNFRHFERRGQDVEESTVMQVLEVLRQSSEELFSLFRQQTHDPETHRAMTSPYQSGKRPSRALSSKSHTVPAVLSAESSGPTHKSSEDHGYTSSTAPVPSNTNDTGKGHVFWRNGNDHPLDEARPEAESTSLFNDDFRWLDLPPDSPDSHCGL